MDSDDSLAEHAKLECVSTHITRRKKSNENGTEKIKKLHPVVMQQMLQPRCRSSVWVYFQRLDTALAKCRICHNKYRFGSSISNLRHHAELKHADVLKHGPVKFLERLKVPKEDVAKLLTTTRDKVKSSKKSKNLHEDLSVQVKEDKEMLEAKTNSESNYDDTDPNDVQETLNSIYETSDEILNDYLQSSPKSTNATSAIHDRRSSINISNADFSNNSYFLDDDDEQETDIDCLRSDNFIATNPLNTTLSANNTKKFLKLREDRMRAETNYFNKKSIFMERSAEFIEVQKRHVKLQSEKLKLEIDAMKECLYRS